MNSGLVYSIVLHAAIAALAVFGLPRLVSERPIETRLVVVDVVTVSDVTNAPPPAARAEKRDTPPPPPPKTSPPPPSAVAPPPPPPPPPAAIPVDKPAPPKPQPAPEPVPVEQAEPQPAETAEAAPADPVPALTPPLPRARPTPPPRRVAVREAPKTPEPAKKVQEKPLDLTKVLKTIQQLKEQAESAPEKAEPVEIQASAETTARRAGFDPERALSVSEMDAIRRQIGNCWLVPAGAKNAENLVVEIEVTMNPDRTVRSAEIVDRARTLSDPTFRSAAEHALRALKHPSCSPLELPPERFETWKRFTITFDPKDMLS